MDSEIRGRRPNPNLAEQVLVVHAQAGNETK